MEEKVEKEGSPSNISRNVGKLAMLKRDVLRSSSPWAKKQEADGADLKAPFSRSLRERRVGNKLSLVLAIPRVFLPNGKLRGSEAGGTLRHKCTPQMEMSN